MNSRGWYFRSGMLPYPEDLRIRSSPGKWLIFSTLAISHAHADCQEGRTHRTGMYFEVHADDPQ